MRLPLIDVASSLFDEISLEDCYIIGVQHILYSTHSMFDALFQKGLKRENLSLIGKCYSTEPAVYERMLREGIDVCPSSIHFDSHKAFDESFEENIRKFLEQRKDRINSKAYKKIIILDDGGSLLSIVDSYIDNFENVAGMEQTSAGYNILKNQLHKFPIINLARADAKLALEPTKIVDSTLEKIFDYLEEHAIEPKKVLIIGNGSIGGKLYSTLKDKYELLLRYDADASKSDIAHHEFDQMLGQFDLILGCTGDCSIRADQHRLLKNGCTLASMSSSDREFDALALRIKTAKTSNCWDHITSNGIRLLNCGFPMTFHGHIIDDPKFFQFIRALIMACIFQGMQKQSSKGFVNLCEKLQGKLVSEFQKHLLQEFNRTQAKKPLSLQSTLSK